MALIAMREVSFGFGGPALLEGVNFLINPGERVCLLGRNGCGKSTLLRLIAGWYEADSGEITRQPNLRVAMLDQSVQENVKGSVFETIAQGIEPAGRLLAEYHNLSVAPSSAHDDHTSRLNQLHDQLDNTDAWSKLKIIETIISMAGLESEADFTTLSAGLKRRVLTARALAAEPDLLILDEPTNHLDIESIAWLEEFLLRSQKSLLFVTHDRKFLKNISTRIVEIDRGGVFNWSCNYEDYLKRREQLIAAELGRWKRFDKKLAKEEEWIHRGIKARRRRNEGRVRALQKMRKTRNQRRYQDAQIKIEINVARRSGDIVAEANGAAFSYGPDNAKPIVSDLTTTIIRGDRVGIIGPNGRGKTTLLRLLLGEFAPTGGKIKRGRNVESAYFDQLGGRLKPDKDLIENIGQGYGTVTVNGRKKDVIAYLADFLFDIDQVRSLASTLSGGERNRLQIAKVFTQPSNLLVFDEPTNDLDLETLELLEDMLIDYPGTVLLVSHDREFLNNIVTSILVLDDDGKVKEYIGGYDDWLRQRSDLNAKNEEKTQKKKIQKRQKTKPIRLTFKQKRELKGLPTLIEELEEQIEVFHTKMAQPSFYRQDSAAIAKAKAQLDDLESQLTKAYTRWEELAAKEDAQL